MNRPRNNMHRRQRLWARETAVFATTILVLGVALAGCSKGVNVGSVPSPSSTSVHADIDYTIYVDDAIRLLESEFWRTTDIDWQAVREMSLSRLSEHPRSGEAYLSIDMAIEKLDDGHTRFRRPVSTSPGESSAASLTDLPMGSLLDSGSLGYLTLPGTTQLSRVATPSYPSQLADLVRGLEESGEICGWVLDLRTNEGGSLPIMAQGLSKLLAEDGETFIGYVGNEIELQWSVENGGLAINGLSLDEIATTVPPPAGTTYVVPTTLEPEVVEAALTEPAGVKSPHAPVALLVGNQTASAGEALAISFSGRQDTRTFGSRTRGLPTGVRLFQFADGGSLQVANSVPHDRNGIAYIGPIEPDERVVDLFPFDDVDEVLDEAAKWVVSLGTYESCAAVSR